MIHVTAPPLWTRNFTKGFFAILKVCVFVLKVNCSHTGHGFDGVQGKVEPWPKHRSNPDCPDNLKSLHQVSSTLPQYPRMRKPNCLNQIWEVKVSTHWRPWVMPPSWHQEGTVALVSSGGRPCEAPKIPHLLLQFPSWLLENQTATSFTS